MPFVPFDGFVDGVQLLVVLTLFQVHVALSGDVAAGGDVVDQFTVLVYHRMDAEFYVFVYAQLWLLKMLADVYHLQ